MRVEFCGGVPVNYSPPGFATSGQRPCATQSTGGSTDVSSVDSFYSPSPTQPLAETAQPPQQPHSHSNSLSNHAHSNTEAFAAASFGEPLQTYPQPHQQFQPAVAGQGMWLTPPPTASDDFENYSYQDSPMSTNCAIQSADPYSAHSSVNSPRSQSSPDSQQLNFQPAVPNLADQIPFHHLRVSSPSQHESSFHQQMTAASPYAGAIYTGANSDSTDTIMQQQSAPPTILDLPQDSMKEELEETASLAESKSALHQTPRSNSEDTSKPYKPYAQLLYQCFMESPAKMMKLQEVYDWFQENTDKPQKSPGPGWCNSIRHNLSMNAAFVKRPNQCRSPNSRGEAKESKRNTEWHLEEWAIRDGVQSTTRYRIKPQNRRGGSTQPKLENGNSSARACSGRKGGITASKTKAAASKKGLARGGAQSSAAYGFGNSSERNAMQEGLYDRPFDYHYSPSVRGAPVTPPDFNAGDLLIPDPGHAASSQGYMYQGTLPHTQSHHHGYLQNQHQQPHIQQQQPYHSSGSPFSMTDVSGVYHGPPVSLSGRGQGVSTAMPTDYPLFANADDMNMQWPGTGASGEYQP